MSVFSIPVEIWWGFILPELDFLSLVALYHTARDLRPVIEGYKNWDDVYRKRFFRESTGLDNICGFLAVVARSRAEPLRWGKIRGAEDPINSPQPFGPKEEVLQLATRCFLTRSSSGAKLLGAKPRWVAPQGMNIFGGRVYTGRFETEWETLFLPREPDSFVIPELCDSGGSKYCGLPITIGQATALWKFFEKECGGETTFEGLFTGVGIAVFSTEGNEIERILVPEAAFMKPLKSYCPVYKGQYMMLSISGELLRYFDGTIKRFPLNLVPMKSIHPFDLRYDLVKSPGKVYGFRGKHNRCSANSLLLLGEDGHVYYHHPAFNPPTVTKVPNLKKIVKLAVGEGAFFALSSEGRVFFMGSSARLKPGVSVEGLADEVVARGPPPILPRDVWPRPRRVTRRTDRGIEPFYAVLPLEVPLDGCVVDIHVFKSRVVALVASPRSD